MIIQFCGLSGSGKTTLAETSRLRLAEHGINIEVIDGDEYRKIITAGLGFSKEDRAQNIRRLAFIAGKFSAHGIVTIICAINPYEDIRREVKATYANVQTVFIDCEMDTLLLRDTKGLYKRALLPHGHADKISNLTGVNDPFERPADADLVIYSAIENIEESTARLTEFILSRM